MKKIPQNFIKTFLIIFSCLSLMALFGFRGVGFSGDLWPKNDYKIFQRKIQQFKKPQYSQLSFNQLIIKVGKSFLGTPYGFYTLDQSYPEKLVINLRKMDCLTYLENVLAISKILKTKKLSFEDFKNEIQLIRYRSGGPVTYINRLHYYTEWLEDAEKKGILKNIVGPDEFRKPIFLLSKNTSRKNDVDELKRIENKLSQKTVKYFSCQTLANTNLDELLQDGDIVGFTSNVEGLDVNHVVFALKQEDRWTFLNASSVGEKEVEIYKGDLVEYCNRVKANTGIVLARPTEITK
ncbi:MAG: DUF1460 domain-containing protein [Candidatus Caenarcaniphilales bacterium]|nr:DUF1460 domain-containing protein [Candidatus Caenarcaniphilales bacterium]